MLYLNACFISFLSLILLGMSNSYEIVIRDLLDNFLHFLLMEETITFSRFPSSSNRDININLLFNVYKRYVTHLLFIKIACTVVFCWTICNICKWVKIYEIVSTLDIYPYCWQRVDFLFPKFSILKCFFFLLVLQLQFVYFMKG